jgi:NhaA family Na+:H+ antiporter
MTHEASPSSVTADQAAPAPLAPAVHQKGALVKLSLFIVQSLWVLPFGCVVGMVWATIDAESYFRLTHPLTFAVNDVGIALFFAMVTKEVVEAALPGGALHPWRRALLPGIAAVGGVAASVGVYFVILQFVGEPMLMSAAWTVPCATDIAMCYLVSGLIFGRHPALPFILLLAIASNGLGITLMAIFHPTHDRHLALFAILLAAAMSTAYAMRRGGTKRFWPYLILPGTLSWWALYFGGVHPAMALVPIVPLMPHAARDAGLFVEPSPKAHDTLSEFERWWEIPVQAVLFLFGLINSGVPMQGIEAGMWAMPVAMIIGRPIGVLLAAEAGVAAGLHRTLHVGWRETLVIGCASSVGLSLALYFSTAVVPAGPLLLQLRSGALLSTLGIATAFAAAKVLGVGRFERKRSGHAPA